MTEVPKILYISDSLGTPIHPRGIFNFSLSFIEVLKSLGGNVTLVVEGTPGYGVKPSDFPGIQRESQNAIKIVQLSELLRYFFDGRFINWMNIQGRFGKIPYVGRLIVFYLLMFYRLKHFFGSLFFRHKTVKIENAQNYVDFLP